MEGLMSLSKQSIETLLDLVEIKISYMDVFDRDDAKELRLLERCRHELKMVSGEVPAPNMAFARAARRMTPMRHDLAAV
jgi:hypothetical protein